VAACYTSHYKISTGHNKYCGWVFTTLTSHLKDPKFKSWLADWLHDRFVVMFLSPSRQMLG
jgi:hypothetical protein